MNSEKVKKIKKIAMSCVEKNKPHCKDCPKGDEDDVVLTCRSLLKDILTYINELESENKELKKYRCDWLNSEKMHLESELEETEFELGFVNRCFQEIKKENQNLKNRIAELEKENVRLTNVMPYQVVISDDKFEELKKNAIEDFNLTKIMLKQFAERLKEQMNEGEYMGEKYKLSVFRDIDIDETLKEFLEVEEDAKR